MEYCCNMTINRHSRLWNIFFLLLYTGPPKFRVRDFDASLLGQYDLPVLVQIGVYLLAGLFVAREILRAWHHLPIYFPQKLAMAFLATLGLSISVSNSPALTLFKVYQFTVVFLFAGLFLDEFGLRATLKLLILGNAILCILDVLAIPFIHEGMLEMSETGFPRLRGSAIAEAGVVGVFLCVLLLSEAKRRSWFLLVFAGLITFFSLARSSWGAVLAVVALIAIFRPKIWSVRLSRIIFAVSAFALLVVGPIALTTPFRDPTAERGEIWAYTIGQVLDQSPWRGLGYGVASRTLVADIDPALGSAHSIFVDVFLGGGFIALAPFLVAFFIMGVDASKVLLKRNNNAEAFSCAALFVSFMVISLVGGELDWAPFGFTFFALMWMLPYARRTDFALDVSTRRAPPALTHKYAEGQIQESSSLTLRPSDTSDQA
jgi:O-antigen ligase